MSRRGSLLLPPVLETCDRARDTMVELAWEMPLDKRFSVAEQERNKRFDVKMKERSWEAKPEVGDSEKEMRRGDTIAPENSYERKTKIGYNQ